MDNEKRTNKRKLLIRYLILAACILLIASITVISICAANDWFRVSISDTVDKGDNDDKPDEGNTDGGNTGDNTDNTDDNPSEDDKPTSGDTSWVSPVSVMNVITPYDFVEDVTLMNMWHFHTGLDLAAEVGTPVVCCFDGVVESIVTGDELDGNKVTVKHADGVKTVYSFIDVTPSLKAGDSVKKGETLGTVAEPTGKECMLEAHVHFEVIENGESANPDKYLDVAIK
ncbi:MAG: peptidoglycan DD-metalloendopeptidase family protein [Candidatus Coproplasma sp.]